MSHTFLPQVFAKPEDERWPNNLSRPKMLNPSLPSKLRRFVQTLRISIGQDGHSHSENRDDQRLSTVEQRGFGIFWVSPNESLFWEKPWIVLRMPWLSWHWPTFSANGHGPHLGCCTNENSQLVHATSCWLSASAIIWTKKGTHKDGIDGLLPEMSGPRTPQVLKLDENSAQQSLPSG